MNNKRAVSFLKFMHKIIRIDKSVDYVQECLKHYQTILTCYPRLILTNFLLEIGEQFVVELLEKRDNIWITYFVGLIQLGYMKDLDDLIMYLRRIYQDDYILTLIKLFIREVSNEHLSDVIRQYIFDYICTSPNMVLFMIPRENDEEPATFEELIDQMDDWSLTFPQWMIDEFRFVPELPQQPQPEHQAVHAEAFVEHTFPSLHPLDPNHVYECGICKSGSDDEDGLMKVFRSMPCCPQMCCHDCLVHQATVCNTPDRESKNTSIFICPFSRHQLPFFPPNP